MLLEGILKFLSRIYRLFIKSDLSSITSFGYFSTIVFTATIVSLYTIGILGYLDWISITTPKSILLTVFLTFSIVTFLMLARKQKLIKELHQRALIPLNYSDLILLLLIILSFPFLVLGLLFNQNFY